MQLVREVLRNFGSQSLGGRLLSNGVWAFAGTVVTTFAGFAISAVLTRVLSPTDVGGYFLIVSMVTILSTIALFGLPQSNVRLLAQLFGTGRFGRARAILVVSFRYAAFSAGVVSLWVYLGGAELASRLFRSESISGLSGALAAWVFLTSLQVLIVESFRGLQKIRLASALGAGPSVLTFAFVVTLWFATSRNELDTVLALAVLATCLSALFGGGALWKAIATSGKGGADVAPRQILSHAWPFWIVALSTFVLLQADLWVIGTFRPHEEVALYGAASRLALLSALLHTVIHAFAQPAIAELFARGDLRKLERLVRISASAAFLPALALTLVYFAAGQGLLGLLYGPFYGQAIPVLLILSSAQTLVMAVGPVGSVLLMTGHQRTYMTIIVAGGIFNITASIFAVHHFGMVGVASACGLGYLLQALMGWQLLRMRLGVNTHVAIALRARC